MSQTTSPTNTPAVPDSEEPNDLVWPLGIASRDVALLAVVALLAIVIRAAWLTWPVFNPDESIYAARASYLLAEGSTAFQRPIGVEHAVEVYRWLGRMFGAHCMLELRLLILVLCIFVAKCLYAMTNSAARRATAFLAATLFVYFNVYFEGLSGNREWFAVSGVSAAGVCFLWSARVPARTALVLLATSGLCAGTAFWFKQQAVPLLAPIPLMIAVGLVPASARFAPLVGLGAFAAGMGIAAVGYLTPFLLAGSLQDHLHFLVDFRARYVADASPGSATEYWPMYERLWLIYYQALPGRRLFLLSYVAAGWFAVEGLVAACRRKQVGTEVTVGMLLALNLLCSLVATSFGGRYFSHYFLLAVPWVSGLVALAVWRLVKLAASDQRSLWPIAALAALLVTDLLFVQGVEPIEQFLYVEGQATDGWTADVRSRVPSFRTMIAALAVLLILVAGLNRLLRTRPHVKRRLVVAFGAVASTLLVFDVGWLAAKVHMYPSAVARAEDESFESEELLGYLAKHASPDDRLLVWGFYPELYTYSRIDAASQLVTAVLVLGDVRGMAAGPPQIDPYYSPLLLEEIGRHQPRYILNAAPRSIHPDFYALTNYPPLAEVLNRDYALVETLDGIEIYELQP